MAISTGRAPEGTSAGDRSSDVARPFRPGTGAGLKATLEEARRPEAGRTPWLWTAAAVLVGLALFFYYGYPAQDRTPTEYVRGTGRTGAATGVPAGTAVPEVWQGK